MPTLNKDDDKKGTKVNKDFNGDFDLDLFKKALNKVEASGNMDYDQLSENSNAVGPYQIIYGDVHKSNLRNMYGIESKEEFINSPDVQEEYMNWLATESYPKMIRSLKDDYGPGGKNLSNNAVSDFSQEGILGDYSDYDLMAIEHFLGHPETREYMASIREGREDQFKPKGKVNLDVGEYLNRFRSVYDNKEEEEEPKFRDTKTKENQGYFYGSDKDESTPMKFTDDEDNPMDDLGK